MNAYSPPVRIPSDNEDAAPSDDCCDLCCAFPVRTELDGDKLCQECADKWCRNERPYDDLLPLDHPAMQQALAHYKQVARDAEILRLSKAHRQFNRQMPGGRVK